MSPTNITPEQMAKGENEKSISRALSAFDWNQIADVYQKCGLKLPHYAQREPVDRIRAHVENLIQRVLETAKKRRRPFRCQVGNWRVTIDFNLTDDYGDPQYEMFTCDVAFVPFFESCLCYTPKRYDVKKNLQVEVLPQSHGGHGV